MPATSFVVHSYPGCPWCRAARDLLKRLGATVTSRTVSRTTMAKLVKPYHVQPTAPQIFLWDVRNKKLGRRIGGFDDLVQYLGIKPGK